MLVEVKRHRWKRLRHSPSLTAFHCKGCALLLGLGGMSTTIDPSAQESLGYDWWEEAGDMEDERTRTPGTSRQGLSVS